MLKLGASMYISHHSLYLDGSIDEQTIFLQCYKMLCNIESCVAPGAEQNESKLPGSYPDSSESM